MAKRKDASYMTPGEQIAGVIFFIIYLVVLPFVTDPLFRALEKLLAVNAPLCSANREMLERMVPFVGCDVKVKTTAVKTTEKGLLLRDLETEKEEEVAADTVILAVGFQPDTWLFEEMQDADEIYAIGDCRQFKNVHQAVWDAYEVANHI